MVSNDVHTVMKIIVVLLLIVVLVVVSVQLHQHQFSGVLVFVFRHRQQHITSVLYSLPYVANLVVSDCVFVQVVMPDLIMTFLKY